MSILCVGEMIADLVVHPVSKVNFDNTSSIVDNVQIGSGGDAFNNSVNLSRLGNNVFYVGRVGNDVLGDYLLQKGKEEGVNMEYTVRSDTTPHTKSFIMLNEQGDRSFLYYPGTSAEFCFEDIDLSLLEKCDVLQIGGTFHLPKFDGKGAVKLLSAAKDKGLITSMDVTHDFSGKWNEIIQPCYPFLDYFIPSIEQAVEIAGMTHVPDIAESFLKKGVKNVLIKLGDKGSYFQNELKAFYCSAYDVPVKDTTGAGDAFVSGFLTALKKDYTIEDCVKFGTASSALVIQCVGAANGLKDMKSVQQFIKEKEELSISYNYK